MRCKIILRDEAGAGVVFGVWLDGDVVGIGGPVRFQCVMESILDAGRKKWGLRVGVRRVRGRVRMLARVGRGVDARAAFDALVQYAVEDLGHTAQVVRCFRRLIH